MSEILPSWHLLSAFFLASFILAVTPGPGVFYIVTRSLTQGRRSGLASVLGVALGNLGNALAAALGLGAVLAMSSNAFLLVKYAGALYLVYLGMRTLRAARTAEKLTPVSERVVREGFLVALLNPKTAIFFAAFLPQFMSLDAAPLWQAMTLGVLFVLIAAVTDTFYAVAASGVAPLLNRAQGVRRSGRYLTGGAFIGLGLLAAVTDSRK